MEDLYIGIKGRVLRIDRLTGATKWTAHLLSRQFVNVHLEGTEVIAATHGELFCLDAETGALKWRNRLPGLGRGLITIAGSAGNAAAMDQLRQDEEAAAAAAS